MIKFCRNCGKKLVVTTDKTCPHCGASAVKATAFCRYCGHSTNIQDVTCKKCGAAVKPLPSSVKALWETTLAKWGKRVNLSIVTLLIGLYIIFSLPPSVTKPLQATTADAIMASVGYTALPLNSISAIPPRIPRSNPENTIRAFQDGAIFNNPDYIPVFSPGDTRQLTVTALYRNTATSNSSSAGRTEEVTANCTYRSANDKIANVTAGGLVQAVSVGSTNIIISYTAAPGSANFSESRSKGKTPITVTTMVPVIVTRLPVSLGGKP